MNNCNQSQVHHLEYKGGAGRGENVADVSRKWEVGFLPSLSHTVLKTIAAGQKAKHASKQFSSLHFTHTILNSGSEKGSNLPVSQAALDWEVRSPSGCLATSASGAWEQDLSRLPPEPRNRRSCSLDLHAATEVSSFWGSFIAGQRSHTRWNL